MVEAWKIARYVSHESNYRLLHVICRDIVLRLAKEFVDKKNKAQSTPSAIASSEGRKKRKRNGELVTLPVAGPSNVTKTRDQEVVDLSDDTEDELSDQEEQLQNSESGSKNNTLDRKAFEFGHRVWILTLMLAADALVDCPLCGRKMSQELIWDHTASGCKAYESRSDPAKKKKEKDEWRAMFHQNEGVRDKKRVIASDHAE